MSEDITIYHIFLKIISVPYAQHLKILGVSPILKLEFKIINSFA